MKEVLVYIGDFTRSVNKKVFALCSLLTALLIILNYQYDLEDWLKSREILPWPSFSGHWLLFFFAFALPYFFYSLIEKKKYFRNKPFLFLLVVAPAIFSLKIAMNTDLHFSDDVIWNEYWNQVYYWPVRLLITTAILVLLWERFDKAQPFYGLSTKNFKWRPYLLMLLIMIPLIAMASTQPDFLAMYPKLASSLPSTSQLSGFHKLLFELSYGSDFFTIELFFRGFLVLAFRIWVG